MGDDDAEELGDDLKSMSRYIMEVCDYEYMSMRKMSLSRSVGVHHGYMFAVAKKLFLHILGQ